MSKSYKPNPCKSTVNAALEDGVAALVSLGEECRESGDNFENQSHPKAEAFGEVADALENLSLDIDLPDDLAELEVSYTDQVPRRKAHNPSRASRCGNAVAALQAGFDGLQSWLDRAENTEHEKRDEVDSLATEVENMIGEAESVEFPGLYG